MTTHTPRARLVRNSRLLRRADEIIDAAARVFAERGYHGTSTQAIADVVGMRQASLYYYFPSKEAALEVVCARGVEGHAEAAEAIVAGIEDAQLVVLEGSGHMTFVEQPDVYLEAVSRFLGWTGDDEF